MADLTRIGNLPQLQPQVDTSVNADPTLAFAQRGLALAERGFDQLAYDNQRKAKAAKEQADATVLGKMLEGELREGASFLEEASVEAIQRDAAQRVIDTGGNLGQTGDGVLHDAANLSNSTRLLRQSGRYNTLNQLRILRKQADLIHQRPDLAEDIIKVTNAAAADANKLLKEDQDREIAENQRLYEQEQTTNHKLLVDNNLYNPEDDLVTQRRKVAAIQFYKLGQQQAIDNLPALEREDKALSIADGRDERALKRDQRRIERARIRVANSEFLPNSVQDVIHSVNAFMAMPGTGDERLASWRQFAAQKVAVGLRRATV